MSSFTRPAPDRSKIIEAWQRWIDDDQAMPGRTMADLKIAGADLMIEALLADHPSDPSANGEPGESGESGELGVVAQAWDQWERGRSGPQAALDALGDAGFGRIVEALAAD